MTAWKSRKGGGGGGARKLALLAGLFALLAGGLTAMAQTPPAHGGMTWTWDEGQPKFTYLKTIPTGDRPNEELKIYKLSASGKLQVNKSTLRVKDARFAVWNAWKTEDGQYHTIGDPKTWTAERKAAEPVAGSIVAEYNPIALKDPPAGTPNEFANCSLVVQAQVILEIYDAQTQTWGPFGSPTAWVGLEPRGKLSDQQKVGR